MGRAACRLRRAGAPPGYAPRPQDGFGREDGRVRWRVAAGVAALTTAGALSGATTAGAQGFGCDASALRGTLLGGTAVEPVTANRGQATCRSAHVSAPLGVPLVLDASSLIADTALTGTPNRVDQQAVTATGAVSDLRIGELPSLP